MTHVCGHLTQGPQGRFVSPSDDMMISRLLRETGVWCWQELRPLLAKLRPSDRVLVVGAHLGTTVVPISKLVNRVTAIEANPEMARYLRANLALNDCTNVDVIEGAAAASTGEVNFCVNRWNSGSSHCQPEDANPAYRENWKFHDADQTTISVKAFPLDQVVGGHVDVIFMDIEGSEFAALGGMIGQLKSARMLVMEYFATHVRDIAQTTPEAFAARLQPHFDRMWSPKYDIHGTSAEFPMLLRRMSDQQLEEDGLVFWKHEMNVIDPTGVL